MSTMSVKEALAKVLNDMKAMSAEQLRVELTAHRHGEIAIALREVQQFLAGPHFFFAYSVNHAQSLLQEDITVATVERSLRCLEELLAANDNSYALAA